jgi:hypothetical protein
VELILHFLFEWLLITSPWPPGTFQLSFNASLKIDFQGSRVTSDGGRILLVRELDERLGFGELITQHLSDSRRGKNTQLPLADLFRQSVYSRIAGYKDVNDAPQRVVLDMDSTKIPVYGQQENSAYNGAKTPPGGRNATRRTKGWRFGLY